jgi:hypothetical protein
MSTRVKILNAIKDCTLEPIDFEQMECYAEMEEWELRDELIAELYSLKEAYDNLLDKANVDSFKLLDRIERLNLVSK